MLLLEESASLLKDWTFEIHATDLNERSVAHAKQGVYDDYSTRNLTPYYRQKYFRPAGQQLAVNAGLKARVNFSRLNLLDDARMAFLKGMDVIFCCNVLIYFDGASKRRVIQHFYSNLLPHGYLFLGHSESLFGVNDDFRLVHLPSATAYIRSDRRQVTR
jgi:chemotaxis protein methyltransferase CheR